MVGTILPGRAHEHTENHDGQEQGNPAAEGGAASSAPRRGTRTLFARQDYRSTTTREIAEKAGVAEHLLFRNFGSKAALFREALVVPFTSFVDEFSETWRSVVPEETDEEELAAQFVGQLYDLFVENRGLVMTLWGADSLSEEELVDAGIADIDRAIAVLGRHRREGHGHPGDAIAPPGPRGPLDGGDGRRDGGVRFARSSARNSRRGRRSSRSSRRQLSTASCTAIVDGRTGPGKTKSARRVMRCSAAAGRKRLPTSNKWASIPTPRRTNGRVSSSAFATAGANRFGSAAKRRSRRPDVSRFRCIGP